MSHGKYESRKKPVPVLVWILIVLALVGMSFGGAVAYLSASTPQVENDFTVASAPNPQVYNNNNGEYYVDIGDPGYAVYVRAAVVVNWKNKEGNVLAVAPTEFSITPGDNWFEHGGFYYYNEAVNNETVANPIFTSISANTSKTGYTLTVDVAVQTIQALGTTDEDNVDAVKDAWGMSASEITGASE